MLFRAFDWLSNAFVAMFRNHWPRNLKHITSCTRCAPIGRHCGRHVLSSGPPNLGRQSVRRFKWNYSEQLWSSLNRINSEGVCFLLSENKRTLLSVLPFCNFFYKYIVVDSRCGIMRVPTSIVFLSIFVILSTCMSSIQCEKGKLDEEEHKSQNFPPCAACKILTNSFKKVNNLPPFLILYWSI